MSASTHTDLRAELAADPTGQLVTLPLRANGGGVPEVAYFQATGRAGFANGADAVWFDAVSLGDAIAVAERILAGDESVTARLDA